MIKPTVGRIVWFYNDAIHNRIVQRDQPLAAIVAYVWNDRLVNLHVIDADGVYHPVTSVQLVQEGDVYPTEGMRCEWMPYQVGQAKKEEGK